MSKITYLNEPTPEQKALERLRARKFERHGAASLRAVAGQPNAEYRAQRLLVDGKSRPFAAPYLGVDFGSATLAQSRGVADALALRLRYSDARLHTKMQPEHSFARIVFDILEQLRCESLADPALQGVGSNLEETFSLWCQQARSSNFVETSLGILLYTIIHMVRARLIRNVDDEEIAALIEATRANLAPLIGTPFYHLPKHRMDQQKFAEHAVEIAETLAQLSGVEGEKLTEPETRRRQFAALPPDWDMEEASESEQKAATQKTGTAASAEVLATAGDYSVFTREYDSEVTGSELYRADMLNTCRRNLDALVSAQAVSVPRLALRLQRLFAEPVADDWQFGQEEGWLDARRLTQLVSNSSYSQVFYKDLIQPKTDVAVSFLIDNTGSMKTQRFEAVAVLVDTFSRALELAGAKSEILGFTTSDWNGGRAMRDWHAAHAPENPGRLSETQHIVYKSADSTWRQSRASIAALLKTLHYREGVDGEALLWAYQRLLARPEKRRILVMISDGAPMDAATDNANRSQFLLDHLCTVANHIDTRSPVAIGCIGIDLDTSFFIRNSVAANLTGTLGNSTYRILEELFPQ